MVFVLDDAKLLQDDRQMTLTYEKKCAKHRQETLQKKDAANPEKEIRNICAALLRIAQRYTPNGPTAYADFSEVVRCAKLLKAMGLEIEVADRFSAPVAAAGIEVITNSHDYRCLHNKAVAGFATIADLTQKATATGPTEFKRGVYEGYRRASALATSFLEDIENGGS